MNILTSIERYFKRIGKKGSIMRRRRESVVSVYKKTTKFITANTPSLLKIMPNKKYKLLARLVEEHESNKREKIDNPSISEEDDDLGERDLDYYLGVRKKESFWRDPAGKEQIRKDFLVYHCGLTEQDYEDNYKRSAPKASYLVQRRLRQVPFKIHRKRKTGVKDDSWREKRLFKLFAYKRESEYSTSDSYSECSNEDRKDSVCGEGISSADGSAEDDEEGVRIKEVSEGRPCDNCPELCPGFIPHAWRKTCKSCGCDRLKHSVYHEEMSSVRERLGLRDSPLQALDSLPGLNAKETELFWQSLSERITNGSNGPASWRSWRNRALAAQLPKQDLSLAHCRHVEDVHRKQYEDFVAARNEIALDIGVGQVVFGKSLECMGCSKPIRSGNIAVEAPRLGEQAYYHPSCFTCVDCEEPLVEFAYCALDGRLHCVRHYAERLKPRCHACDELFKSSPGAVRRIRPVPLRPGHRARPFLTTSVCSACEMGLVLSAVISYAGVHEAIECLRHIISGIVPEDQPGFDALIDYYTKELRRVNKAANDWTDYGQGYLCLIVDDDGKLKSAAIKGHHSQPDSTAILFSTKISSFGDSVEEAPAPTYKANGDYRAERYSPARTKTLVSNSSESFTVVNRNKSPGADTRTPERSTEPETTETVREESPEKKEKLTWQYTPIEPAEPPQIHFQSYDDDKPGVFTDDYLRSLDGIKYRPLQRSDPSGRRRSFRKRHSSSSNSSRDSRASRDEELKLFTSLEDAEFGKANGAEEAGFGSAPNLSARSSSRSRSRERRNESADESVDLHEGVKLTDAPLLGSFDEATEEKEVIEEEDDVDFWGNGD